VNRPKENQLQHSQHGESFKPRIIHFYGKKSARNIRLFAKLRIKLFFSFTRPIKMEQSVPKRRHINSRRPWATRKIEHNNTGNVRVTLHRDALVQNHCCIGKGNGYYKISVYIFSLRYSAGNVHAPFCHLCPARLYNTFPHYLINGKILPKKEMLFTRNVCFEFLCYFSLNNFPL
jgi:hypothetical protein